MDNKTSFKHIEGINKLLGSWQIIYSKCDWRCYTFGIIPYLLSSINIAYNISINFSSKWVWSLLPTIIIFVASIIYSKRKTKAVLNGNTIENIRLSIVRQELNKLGFKSKKDYKYIIERLYRKNTSGKYKLTVFTGGFSIAIGIIISKYVDYIYSLATNLEETVKVLSFIVSLFGISLALLFVIDYTINREILTGLRRRNNLLVKTVEDLYFTKLQK